MSRLTEYRCSIPNGPDDLDPLAHNGHYIRAMSAAAAVEQCVEVSATGLYGFVPYMVDVMIWTGAAEPGAKVKRFALTGERGVSHVASYPLAREED